MAGSDGELLHSRRNGPPLMVRKQAATADFEGEEASRRYNLHWITGTGDPSPQGDHIWCRIWEGNTISAVAPPLGLEASGKLTRQNRANATEWVGEWG